MSGYVLWILVNTEYKDETRRVNYPLCKRGLLTLPLRHHRDNFDPLKKYNGGDGQFHPETKIGITLPN